MVSYFGRPTATSACDKLLAPDLGKRGVTAAKVAAVARYYGLNTRAYLITDIAALPTFDLPCIIHWNYVHFVVLEQFDDEIRLMDPAVGKRHVSLTEFADAFSGVLITFDTSEDFRCSRSGILKVWWEAIAITARASGSFVRSIVYAWK